MKKIRFILWVVAIVLAYVEADACTEPTKKAAVKVADDDCLVFEYFQPAKASAKKKTERPISIIADSILSAAKESFDRVDSKVTNSTYEHMSIDMQTELGNYRTPADNAVRRTKIWADSICNLFRRGNYYSKELDTLPR